MVTHVQNVLSAARADDVDFNEVFDKVKGMADKGNVSIEPPRYCKKATYRNNCPSDNAQEYFKRAIYLPFLDSLISQLSLRFGTLSSQAMRALALLPNSVGTVDKTTVDAIFNYYKPDLPSPETFF